MDIDDLLHRFLVGEGDEVEEAAAQEGVRQLFLVIGRDDHDRTLFGLDRLAGLVDIELHPVELLQEVVGEFDIGLVDLVDQQDRAHIGVERLPQLALADIVFDVVDLVIAQLGIAQARHGVVFIKPLMRLGGRLDVPLDQRRPQRGRDLARQLGLAGARLALHQQRTLENDGGVHRGGQLVCGHIILGAFKTHVGCFPCFVFCIVRAPPAPGCRLVYAHSNAADYARHPCAVRRT